MYGDVELIALGVEDRCYFVDWLRLLGGRGILGDDVERVYRYNSDVICDVHCLCDCH